MEDLYVNVGKSFKNMNCVRILPWWKVVFDFEGTESFLYCLVERERERK